MNYDGMRVWDAVASLGMNDADGRQWLRDNGYTINNGYARKAPDLVAAQREWHNRVATAPASFPCRRCGAARACEHRDATGARWAA